MKLDYFEQLEVLAAQQGGYFYPWCSALREGNCEDAYTQRVEAYLSSALPHLGCTWVVPAKCSGNAARPCL